MDTLIRTTHRYGFRSGEWAKLEGVTEIRDRLCFKVRFYDNITDEWVIADPQGEYEFMESRTPYSIVDVHNVS